MTLVLKVDLDIMIPYFYTKHVVKRSFRSKVAVGNTGRQTDRDRRAKLLSGAVDIGHLVFRMAFE